MSPFLDLVKVRILVMQLVTLSMGYALAAGDAFSAKILVLSMIGTAVVSGGAGALNHYYEREIDTKMGRTQNRPIPSGHFDAVRVHILAWLSVVLGSAFLYVLVNPFIAFLALITAVFYVIYTVLKPVSWLNTLVGAIPGAMAPLGGWVAATGTLTPMAWSLFLILFIWQLPHFYAIAWMYKEDYSQAGFKMISVLDETGEITARQILVQSFVLILVSELPIFLGQLHLIYAVSALFLGLWVLARGITFSKFKSKMTAKAVLKVTVYYLPLLLLAMMVDQLLPLPIILNLR